MKQQHLSLSRAEAEAFLYAEARLLDEGRLEEWLQLFTADGLYWIPIDADADPARETSIMYDDAEQREKRVYQLRHGHLAQDPPSRTLHFISNVAIGDKAADGEARLYCNMLVYEMRPGDHQQLQHGLGEPRILAARCGYRLRREGGAWRIAFKQVTLVDRDLPLQNITFIL
jgi:3-phenylpropionate/cinnamic acid dioxygenase small subunit